MDMSRMRHNCETTGGGCGQKTLLTASIKKVYRKKTRVILISYPTTLGQIHFSFCMISYF